MTSSLHSPAWTALTARLREQRIEAGISQTELARRVGLDQSVISRIERNERRIDALELVKISSALGLSLHDLVRQLDSLPTANPPVDFELARAGQSKHWPESDGNWKDEHWIQILDQLIRDGLVSWMQVASLVLGHFNPSQVGTSIASKRSFQRHYLPRQTWRNVRTWHFEQDGSCVDCGSRLELQADHMVSKQLVRDVADSLDDQDMTGLDAAELKRLVYETLCKCISQGSPSDSVPHSVVVGVAEDLAELIMFGRRGNDLQAAADRLDNMVLRCRRCNVIRRPSHKQGGKTRLTAETALMWLLLTKRPRSYEAYADLCRTYGLTMANIRFEEAWAMARWLNRLGLYEIDPGTKHAP